MHVLKLVFGVLFNTAFFGLLLFLPAGTVDWPRAWTLLALVFVGTIATTIVLYRTNPGLLNERFKPPVQEGQPRADKIVTLLLAASFIGLLVVAPLDVFRFHWGPTPGRIVSDLGLGLFAVGWIVMTLAMQANAFAAPVVKHQEERRQQVVETGLYAYVRHPMYAGAVPLMFGMPLWLESYAGALFALVPLGFMILRILIEEEFLRRELPGYEDYMKKVRYRLIPFLW